MAIDTEDKRRSAMAVGDDATVMMTIPDGNDLDTDIERRTCAGVYGGLTSRPYIPGVYWQAYDG